MGEMRYPQDFKLFLFSLSLFIQLFAAKQDIFIPVSGHRCPMYNIDFYGYDVDELDGLDDWNECGHACSLMPESTCKFWTFGFGNSETNYRKRCIFKSSDEGVLATQGAISGD